jgi:hypothetical protein
MPHSLKIPVPQEQRTGSDERESANPERLYLPIFFNHHRIDNRLEIFDL